MGRHSIHNHRTRHADQLLCWADKVMTAKPFKLVAVAIVNKLARIAYSVLTTDTSYRNAAA